MMQQLTFDQMERIAKAIFGSGYYSDVKNVDQALVKIIAGSEVGIGACASVKAIQIIGGTPSFSAGLISTLIRRSGVYDYRVTVQTGTECAMTFYRGEEKLGESRFTIQDATRAGLAGKAIWKQYPRSMLFARAITQGARMFCPDATSGLPLYTPEELGDTPEPEAAPTPTAPAVEPTPEPQTAPPESEPPAEEFPEADDPFARLDAIIALAQSRYNKANDSDLAKRLTDRVYGILKDCTATLGLSEIPFDKLPADKLEALLDAVRAKVAPDTSTPAHETHNPTTTQEN